MLWYVSENCYIFILSYRIHWIVHLNVLLVTVACYTLPLFTHTDIALQVSSFRQFMKCSFSVYSNIIINVLTFVFIGTNGAEYGEMWMVWSTFPEILL